MQWRVISGLVALPWILTACATTPHDAPWIVPPDARTADQQRQDTADCAAVAEHASGDAEDGTLRTGVLIGLLGGAAGGAALGAAAGAVAGQTVFGTAAGATLGSSIGVGYAKARGAVGYESAYHACLQTRGYRIEARPPTPAPMR